MALRTAPRVTPLAAVRLMWLCLVRPKKFTEEERRSGVQLETAALDARTRAQMIRAALAESFLWVVGSSALGVLAGFILNLIWPHAAQAATAFVIVGAAVILWATLAIRGWEITSYSGATLGELVNRWIFRLMYTIGTVFLVAGSVWLVA